MAHFAQIDENNVVTQVIVVNNAELLDENGIESEQKGIDFCKNLLGGNWIQTSYNAKFRKNFAGIGYVFDIDRDAFISPKPFSSWSLNESTCKWQAPTPCPTNLDEYFWNEDSQSWDLISTS